MVGISHWGMFPLEALQFKGEPYLFARIFLAEGEPRVEVLQFSQPVVSLNDPKA